MKVVLSVLAVALIAFVQSKDDTRVPVNKSDLNPRDFVTLGNQSYYFSPALVDVKEALQFCNDVGMNLLSIETEEENNLILTYLRDNALNTWFWTSGRLLLDIYHWTSTGKIVTNARWYPSRPTSSKSSEACIMTISNTDPNKTGWHDYPCASSQRFICEKS